MRLCFACLLAEIARLLREDIRIRSCKREGNVRTSNALRSPLRDGADPSFATMVFVLRSVTGVADVAPSSLKDEAAVPASELTLTSAARGSGVLVTACAGCERGPFVEL